MIPGLIGLAAIAGMLLLAHATQHGIGVAPDSVSYLEAARNLAAGRGVTTTEEDGAELRPLTRFPPLYPAALAAIARLGPDALDAARWLNLVLFGANIVLASLLVARCAPGARWLPVVAAVLIASSPEIAMLHGTALSEPLFLLLAFSGLLFLARHLETPKGRTLLAASMLIALAFLTRYMGGALVATGILAILLAPKARLNRRVKDAAAFAAIATLPIALWTLRNRLGGAPATGRRFAFHPIDADAIAVATGTVGEWLLARHVGAAPAWLFAAGLLLCTLHWLASGAARAAGAVLPRTLALFVLAYLFLLLASICFFDAATPLNGRILSPVLVAILVLALGGVRARIRAGEELHPRDPRDQPGVDLQLRLRARDQPVGSRTGGRRRNGFRQPRLATLGDGAPRGGAARELPHLLECARCDPAPDRPAHPVAPGPGGRRDPAAAPEVRRRARSDPDRPALQRSCAGVVRSRLLALVSALRLGPLPAAADPPGGEAPGRGDLGIRPLLGRAESPLARIRHCVVMDAGAAHERRSKTYKVGRT